jgi:uncharacterized protein
VSNDTGPPGALSQAECFRLLASMAFGRVIYTVSALPAVTPVNFAMDGRAVVFRTAPGSCLARATEDAVVAFEVDHVDEPRHAGWTVVVTGIARAVHDVSALLRLEQLGLASWAGGDRSHFVRIVASSVTGRRLGVPSIAGPPSGPTPPRDLVRRPR